MLGANGQVSPPVLGGAGVVRISLIKAPVRLTLPFIVSQPFGVASATSNYHLLAFAILIAFMLLFMCSISMETNVSALIGRSKNFAHRLRLTNYGDLE